MAHITHHDVAEILETDLNEAELTAFIEDAHTIVQNRIADYTDDEDTLAAVETYLAAHLATAKEPRVATASHEGADVELDADGNRYWHQAVLLDPTNRLARPNGCTFATT
jgi:hypothetical protein